MMCGICAADRRSSPLTCISIVSKWSELVRPAASVVDGDFRVRTGFFVGFLGQKSVSHSTSLKIREITLRLKYSVAFPNRALLIGWR